MEIDQQAIEGENYLNMEIKSDVLTIPIIIGGTQWLHNLVLRIIMAVIEFIYICIYNAAKVATPRMRKNR